MLAKGAEVLVILSLSLGTGVELKLCGQFALNVTVLEKHQRLLGARKTPTSSVRFAWVEKTLCRSPSPSPPTNMTIPRKRTGKKRTYTHRELEWLAVAALLRKYLTQKLTAEHPEGGVKTYH